MKACTKGPSPPAFESWKALANETWTPTYKNLPNPQKQGLHLSLAEEQGWVCCYCGRSISLSSSHIEHFRPQETYAELALDYSNLHVSCIRETSPDTPLHCGHAKSNYFDENNYISPLDIGCEGRFSYSLNGGIFPSQEYDKTASHMKTILNLDVKFLCNRRQDALARVFDSEFLLTATNEELEALAKVFREPDQSGNLQGFGHVVARYADQLSGHP